ncbi:hypothetical protein [Marinicella gelatinilytica]|uniref:hypothetical protein n=1 Tax=Marinicella gelatinilytica TaxID=2996017 RepID=UPI00226081EE|nr:hypothetical protein [Marinicella gelatinilytica]MCX7545314.1 hypothetical protein [Marinicella gelatinilytica]
MGMLMQGKKYTIKLKPQSCPVYVDGVEFDSELIHHEKIKLIVNYYDYNNDLYVCTELNSKNDQFYLDTYDIVKAVAL